MIYGVGGKIILIYYIYLFIRQNFSSNNINIQGHLKAKWYFYVLSLLAFTLSVRSVVLTTCTHAVAMQQRIIVFTLFHNLLVYYRIGFMMPLTFLSHMST